MKIFKLFTMSIPGVHRVNSKRLGRKLARATVCTTLIYSALLYAQSQSTLPAQNSFPDTDTLMARVVRHQKEVESLLNQYTFTDTTTLYTLDKSGQVRNRHTDIYYITPTAYEFFTLHIGHDGKLVSENDLHKQEKQVEHKMRLDERRAQKPGVVHPKDNILLADIVLKSRFTPLRWDDTMGKSMIVYTFEPKSPVQRKGDLGA
ncbi:MAG: hypothetical protein WB919_15335, partial [Candidatus Sulfotelmatobacter sp.]